jgi:hypothetical protein
LLFPSFSSAFAMLTQPAAFDCGTIMSAFCAPAAVRGPVRSVAFAAKPTSVVLIPADSRLSRSTLAP